MAKRTTKIKRKRRNSPELDLDAVMTPEEMEAAVERPDARQPYWTKLLQLVAAVEQGEAREGHWYLFGEFASAHGAYSPMHRLGKRIREELTGGWEVAFQRRVLEDGGTQLWVAVGRAQLDARGQQLPPPPVEHQPLDHPASDIRQVGEWQQFSPFLGDRA